MKNLIWKILTVVSIVTSLTSCEKYELEDVEYNIPSFYDKWRLIETEHKYLDVNEKGEDSDTNWTIYNGETYIALQTELEFDLVMPGTTEWEITKTNVIVDHQESYELNGYVYPSMSMNPYDQCWDINGNGIEDPFEDINGDGIVDIFDCGVEGLIIGVYNTVRVFNIIKLDNNELYLEFEGQYFEDFDYYTTTLKFERIYN